MRKGLLGALASLFAATTLAIAQVPSGNPEMAPSSPGGFVPAAPAGAETPPSFSVPQTPALPGPETGPGMAPPGMDSSTGGAPVDGTWSGHGYGRGARFWVAGEYLQWWVKSAPLPVPLLTLADEAQAAGTGLPAGALGTPGTPVISPSPFSLSSLPGGRLTVGGWLDCNRCFGLEGSFFALAQKTARFRTSEGPDAGTVALAVPFFDPLTNTESALLVTDPFNQPNATFAGA